MENLFMIQGQNSLLKFHSYTHIIQSHSLRCANLCWLEVFIQNNILKKPFNQNQKSFLEALIGTNITLNIQTQSTFCQTKKEVSFLEGHWEENKGKNNLHFPNKALDRGVVLIF